MAPQSAQCIHRVGEGWETKEVAHECVARRIVMRQAEFLSSVKEDISHNNAGVAREFLPPSEIGREDLVVRELRGGWAADCPDRVKDSLLKVDASTDYVER